MSKSPDNPVDLDQIRELIDLLIEKEVSELVIEREGIKVKICRGTAAAVTSAAPIQQVVAAAPAAAPGAEAAQDAGYEDCVIVTSPMVGTFYRSSEPDADPFVEIGSQVEEGHTLCIVEAMKLMNDIVAESAGEVAAVFVENSEPVEFGQRLFAIRPRG
jgi:acetyl-CoA carboxylase biotin carboxyl carrier protein